MAKVVRFPVHEKQFLVAVLWIFLSAAFWATPRAQAQAIVARPTPTPKATPTPKVTGVHPQGTPALQKNRTAGRVTGVLVSVTAPTKYTCPVQEYFSGTITVNGATNVTYTWVSFDGGTWPQGTLHFSGPGRQTVHEQVKVGTAGQVIHGWMQLKVLTPNAVLSHRQPYTVNCKTAAGRVVAAHVTPAYSTATPCPRQVELRGTITANGPAEVTYTWMSSDNAAWPKSTLRFTGAGTQPAKETWTVGTPGQNVSQWVRLKVLSPNAFMSNTGPVRFRCPAAAR